MGFLISIITVCLFSLADEVVSAPEEAAPVVESPVSGVDLVKGWHRNLKSHIPERRKYVQIPISDLYGKQGFCGAYHYNPDRYYNNERYGTPNKNTRAGITSVQVVDNFVPESVACSLVGVMQEWKKTNCPDPKDKGCRLAYGDCGHKDESSRNKKVWNHGDHFGNCIDLRPMRTGSFLDKPLSPPDEDYDRVKTKELLQLLKKHGGHGVRKTQPPLYSDDEIIKEDKTLALKAKGHHNHVHVCFSDQKACEKLQYYPSICEK